MSFAFQLQRPYLYFISFKYRWNEASFSKYAGTLIEFARFYK